MTIAFMDELTCLSPSPPAAARRASAVEILPGMTVVIGGEERRVVGIGRALDGTLDLRMRDGGTENLHPYRRVSVVG